MLISIRHFVEPIVIVNSILMKGLMEKLVLEGAKVTEIVGTLKRKVTMSRKGFRRRQDTDLEDDAKDSGELLAKLGTISEGN